MSFKTSKFKTKVLPEISLLLVALIWGSGFIVSQMALDAGLSPNAIMLGRFSIAFVLVGIIFFKDILKNFELWHLKGCIICGTLLFAGFIVQTIGLSRSTPANNAFITGSNVVMVPFLWWIVSKKRPDKVFFLCSALSLIGVAILSINPSSGFSTGFGDLLTLISAFLFASQIVATGMLARSIPPTVLVFVQFMVASLLSLVVYLISGEPFAVLIKPTSLFPLIYLGAFSTLVCYMLQTSAQRHVNSGKAAIILSMESLFGPLFSVLLGYDTFSTRMLFGGAAMIVSTLLPDIWMQRKQDK